ncbi:hypothetical protein QTP88_013884 [Uroleucon formosanum]
MCECHTEKSIMATKYSRLCSAHFNPNDFVENPHRLILKEGIVPSNFNYPATHIQKYSKKKLTGNVYSPVLNEIVQNNSNPDCESAATEVLVFLLLNLKKKWKWPIGYWFVDKIKSTVQSQLIKMVIIECNEFGIKIINVTCDGAYAYLSTFKILGCDLDQPYDLIKSDFEIDLFTPNIYFTLDACHNVKLARNALGTFGAFKDEDNNLIENPFAKGLKQPIYIHNIQYLKKKMKNNIEYLYSLKTVTGEYLWKSKKKTSINGLATSVKSTLAIAKDLLANHSFKFLLTYKFSQDAIEIFFGFMRGKFGHNNNPNCLEFKNALRSILLHNSIKMSSGNCALLSPVEDSLFAIK